jgi:hypothetical protein
LLPTSTGTARIHLPPATMHAMLSTARDSLPNSHMTAFNQIDPLAAQRQVVTKLPAQIPAIEFSATPATSIRLRAPLRVVKALF